MSTKNQNYFNKSQARNTNFVHRIQHSTHMIKIYGMPTCPDCTYVEEQIMREVAEEAKESNRKATERYFEAMRRNALAKQAKWAHAIELALNGK